MMYVVIVLAIIDIVNVQAVHSANLEAMIAAFLLACVFWFAMGTYLVYCA